MNQARSWKKSNLGEIFQTDKICVFVSDICFFLNHNFAHTCPNINECLNGKIVSAHSQFCCCGVGLLFA